MLKSTKAICHWDLKTFWLPLVANAEIMSTSEPAIITYNNTINLKQTDSASGNTDFRSRLIMVKLKKQLGQSKTLTEPNILKSKYQWNHF